MTAPLPWIMWNFLIMVWCRPHRKMRAGRRLHNLPVTPRTPRLVTGGFIDLVTSSWLHHLLILYMYMYFCHIIVGEDGGLDPLPPGFNSLTPAQFFPPYLRPLFFPIFFFRVPLPKFRFFALTHLPPAHFSSNAPFPHHPNPRPPCPSPHNKFYLMTL